MATSQRIEEVIGQVMRREGGVVTTNDPLDGGGRTQFGIAEVSNPVPWVDGKVTEEEARAIYLRKYVEWPKFNLITDPNLFAQLVDFGVTSGPQLAIMKLQAIVGVEVDGVLGPKTLTAITPSTNNELVKSRIKMIARLVKNNPSQLKFLEGWIGRALEFLV